MSSGTFAGPRGEGAPCPEAAPGALCTPGRAAVEQSSGNLFVVDSGNNRVQVFKPNGSGTADFLTQFGAGELSAPWGIAIDQNAGQTYVYVADAGNEEIVKYDSDEAAVPSFTVNPGFTSPSKGSGAGEVGDFHAALAVDPTTHDLLVADNANKRIDRFEADGTPDGSFDGAAGSGSPGAFAGPIDLAVNSTGDVYVIDANGDIAEQLGTSQALRYSASGEYKATLGPVGERERVATVAVNLETDEVFVSGDQDAVYEAGPTPYVPVIQLFSAANDPLPTPPITAAAQYDTVSGLAFATGSGTRLYAVLGVGLYNTAPFGSPLIQTFANLFPPDVTIDPVDPGSVSASEAAFSGSVDPNGKQASWNFEYRLVGTANWLSTPGGDAGEGSSPVPVTDQADGLFANSEYEVRLVAESVDGNIPTAAETFLTLPGPPAVETSQASPRTATTAVLNGLVNPLGKASAYHFEYGTSSGYGSRIPLGGGAGIGAGHEFRPVSLRVTGLQPATTYHYRVVAEGPYGPSSGGDRTFTTNASDPAPRGFEMVSPPAKNGLDVAGLRGISSASGDRLVYTANGAFPGAPSATTNNYLSQRASGGWQSGSIDPPASPSISAVQVNFSAFSSDLGRAVMTAYTPPKLTPQDPPGSKNIYGRDTLSGATELLSPAPLNVDFGVVQAAGASRDLSRVIWESDAFYLPGITGHQVYESAEGEVRAVGVLPDETVPAASAQPVHTATGVSSDGSLIYFNSPATTTPEPQGPLYVRVDANSTIEVSAPQRPIAGPDPLGTKPGFFRAASADGSKVLFTSCEKLTEDSTAVGSTAFCVGAAAVNDLYRYDVNSKTLEDLTTADPAGGRVLGVSAISEDGSTVYFVAEGDLADGATAGQPNLYLRRGGETIFVSTLEQSDEAVWAIPNTAVYNSRVTADGNHLAFLSSAPLTEEANSGTPQAFLYDAADGGSLVCASCDPAGGAETAASFQPPGASSVGTEEVYLPQVLSDDGSHLFFNTTQALVPEDGNGKADVYEYSDESGAGLVSTGHGAGDSYLLQASPSGEDAFFTTRQRLVSADRDFNADVYDARVGGGFAEPEVPMPPCTGEACQAAPAPTAATVTGSGAYGGSGNVNGRAAAKCKSYASQAEAARSAANKLRQHAKQASGKQAKRLRKQAAHQNTVAKQKQRQAKQCRGGGA